MIFCFAKLYLPIGKKRNLLLSPLGRVDFESEARRIKCRYDGVNNNMKKTSRKNSSPSEEKKCGSLKIAIRNLDIFVNSFEHLAELAEKTGAVVEKSICETDCGIEFRLSISTADGDNAV